MITLTFREENSALLPSLFYDHILRASGNLKFAQELARHANFAVTQLLMSWLRIIMRFLRTIKNKVNCERF